MSRLSKYLKAVQNQSGGAPYVKLKLSDGSYTQPMTQSAAAEYLYNMDNEQPTQDSPIYTMPSENNQMYTDPDIVRMNEAAAARAYNDKLNSFYNETVLAPLGVTESEYLPHSRGLAAATAVAEKSPVGKYLLPISSLFGLGLWLRNNPMNFYDGVMYDTADAGTAEPDSTGVSNPAVVDNSAAVENPAAVDNQPAPEQPEQEEDNQEDSTPPRQNKTPSDKFKGLRRVGRAIKNNWAPFSNYQSGQSFKNTLRVARDLGYIGTIGGPIADTFFNVRDYVYDPDNFEWHWGVTRLGTAPVGMAGKELEKIHYAGPKDTTKQAQKTIDSVVVDELEPDTQAYPEAEEGYINPEDTTNLTMY